jgi:hypothetical protein
MAFIIVLPGREGSLHSGRLRLPLAAFQYPSQRITVRRRIGRPQKRKRGEWYQLAIKNP